MKKSATLAPGTSYVEWSAIFAGAVIASAISIIFINFGNALGLSIPESYNGENARMVIWAVGLWLFWVQLLASMSGGYLAGRMRAPFAESTPHESEVRDGIHGLLVWALSTVMAAIVVGSAAILFALTAEHSSNVQEEVNNAAVLTKNAGIIFGFATAASAIVSAVATWFVAVLGGEHRDNGIDFSKHTSFIKIAKK